MKLRFVKFLTSRENEIEEQEDDDGTTVSAIPQPGRGQSARPAFLLPSSFPFFSFTRSASPLPPPPQLARRHGSEEQYLPAVPALVVPLLPFFFIKFLKQQSVAGRTWRSTQLADPAVLFNDNVAARPARPHPCLFIKSGARLHSGPNGGPSTAGGAIGKQRPEMNYPVSSPSLTNK